MINNAGTVSVVAGTPCTVAGWSRTSTALPPVKPAIPANSIVLAEVYVANTTTTVASGNIIDKRCTLLSPAATNAVLGGVQLAGDLAGTGSTAAAPKVSGINGVAISAAIATLLSEVGGATGYATTTTLGTTSPTILLEPTTASQTFTLPNNPTTGTQFLILNAGSAACTVAAGASNNIGMVPSEFGVSSFTLNVGRWALLSFNGSTWYGVWFSNQNLESYLAAGSPAAMTSGAWTNITSLSLGPGTWLISGRATFTGTVAALSFVDLILSPNSGSVTSNYAAGSTVIGNIAGASEWDSIQLTRIVTLTATTTVYLEYFLSANAVSLAPSSHQSTAANGATGISAVQIG